MMTRLQRNRRFNVVPLLVFSKNTVYMLQVRYKYDLPTVYRRIFSSSCSVLCAVCMHDAMIRRRAWPCSPARVRVQPTQRWRRDRTPTHDLGAHGLPFACHLQRSGLPPRPCLTAF
eukprot:6210844-Pleurochrysis_carterae.AAC.2